MEEKKSIGLIVKQINNIYEKDFNNRLRRTRHYRIPVCSFELPVSQSERRSNTKRY